MVKTQRSESLEACLHVSLNSIVGIAIHKQTTLFPLMSGNEYLEIKQGTSRSATCSGQLLELLADVSMKPRMPIICWAAESTELCGAFRAIDMDNIKSFSPRFCPMAAKRYTSKYTLS